MDAKKAKKLRQMGGRVTTVQEFLGLNDRDMAVIEMRLKLTKEVKARRIARGMTQVELAKLMRSNQARIAKLEGGDPQTSIELLIRALEAVGSVVEVIVKDKASAA